MDASSLIQQRQIHAEDYTALLVGQYGSREYRDKGIQEESLHELFLLGDTAGVSQCYDIMLYVPEPDAARFFKAGGIEEIKSQIAEKKINLVIVDVTLKPGQLKTLEELLKVRVIGRVELILDIFAMRAKTREAALQVELAQLTYILPRLKGLGGVLSRLGGGIGTRGPGETMLETDRRHIRRRIQKIQKELESVSRHRAQARKSRDVVKFALVGYTNAGKSSLLNALSSSAKKLFAEDRLFATLDSYTRKVYLGEHEYRPLYATITDTVGFIRNLPLNLAAAFKSTLEEILYVDMVVIVADSTSVHVAEEIEVVQEELEKLGVGDKPRLLFLNKDDIVMPDDRAQLTEEFPEALWGNAMSKEGVGELREALREFTTEKMARDAEPKVEEW